MNLRPVEMVKVRVIGLRRDLPKATAALHEAGIVEIREARMERDAPTEDYKVISEQLIKLRAIENYLKKGKRLEMRTEHLKLKEILEESRKLDLGTKLSELSKEAETKKETRRHLVELRKALGPLRDLNVDFSDLKSPNLKYHLGTLSAAKYYKFKRSLGQVTRNYDIVSRPHGDKRVCLLAIDKNAEIGGVFGEMGFVETNISGFEGTPAKILSCIEGRMNEIEKRLKEIEAELLDISEKHYERVIQLREMLEIEADRAEIAAKFGRTDRLFVLEGFMPKGETGRLNECLSEAVGENVLVQTSKANENEAPTLLEHGKVAGPLQFLVEFYALPNLNEIDPTLILFITFPIIYGMMLGDVGYGLLSLAFSLLLVKVFKKGLVAGFAKLWAYASIPSIVFGVIFDEWMGFNHTHLIEVLGLGHLVEGFGLHLPLYKGVSRIEDVTILFTLTLVAGFLQLLLGYALGVINDWGHHRKHAYAKMSWMCVLVGGFFSVAILLFGAFPGELLMYFGGLLALGVLGVIVFEGPMGLFEIPGLAGNVISYVRIAGIGLAGLVPAEFIINKLLLPDPKSGIVMFLVMLPVFFLLHFVNMLLGMVESLAQGARLNLVEFYSKFYKGTGRKFEPFRVERFYTKR